MVAKLMIFWVLIFGLYLGITLKNEQNKALAASAPATEALAEVTDQLVLPPESEFYTRKVDTSDQWPDKGGYFALVAEEACQTYVAANQAYAKYQQLAKSQRVRILYEKSQPDSIDSEAKTWVFLSDVEAGNFLGWAFKDCLALPSDFKKASEFPYEEIAYERFSYEATIAINKAAIFNMTWSSEGSGLFLQGKNTGKLLRYKDLYWLKKVKQDYVYDFFVFDGVDRFSVEHKFQSDELSSRIYTLVSK